MYRLLQKHQMITPVAASAWTQVLIHCKLDMCAFTHLRLVLSNNGCQMLVHRLDNSFSITDQDMMLARQQPNSCSVLQ